MRVPAGWLRRARPTAEVRATSHADRPREATTQVTLIPSSPSQPACPDGVSASHKDTKCVGNTRVTGLSAEDRVGPKKMSRIQMNMTVTVPLTGSRTTLPAAAPMPT